MIHRILPLFLLTLALALLTQPASAQPLPLNPWYAVVYQPESDSLHWISAQGEQASMMRPRLTDEALYRDLRISPDGRTLVIAAQLLNGSDALGIYDLAGNRFLATHQANPGEVIHLGGEQIFTPNSQYFAVGFYFDDFANPAWRVILFDSATGSSTAFIDHNHPDAPPVQLSSPSVQYLDGTYVHFQMIPRSVGGWHTWPAYAWRVFGFDPSQPAISESPYTQDSLQVQLLTGRVVMSYADENYVIGPQNGQTPNFNAVGWGVVANESPMNTVHADGSRYHLFSRWARGGDWIVFLSTDTQENRYWNIALAEGTPGDNSHIPFDPQIEQVYGTSDGYLLIDGQDRLMFSNGFMPNTAQTLAQLSPASDVVYVTPIGVNFMLNGLGGLNNGPGNLAPPPGPAVITATPVPPVVAPPAPPAPADCSTAPAQRVSIGIQARVIPAVGSLNLRDNPNGSILLALGGGDVFNILGGAICEGGLYWWQVNYFGTIGWVAEGVPGEYFIEPFDGVAPPPPPPPPPPPAGGGGLVAPGACANTLPPRLTIGASATVLDGGLRPYNGPGGELIPLRFYQSGTVVTVNAGPECAGGRYWWLITGQARIGRIGQNFESVQGWVEESGDGAYFLAP